MKVRLALTNIRLSARSSALLCSNTCNSSRKPRSTRSKRHEASKNRSKTMWMATWKNYSKVAPQIKTKRHLYCKIANELYLAISLAFWSGPSVLRFLGRRICNSRHRLIRKEELGLSKAIVRYRLNIARSMSLSYSRNSSLGMGRVMWSTVRSLR